MRFTEFLLVESELGYIQSLVDSVVDQMAEEQYYNQDAILRVVRDRLMQDDSYATDPAKLEAALEVASNYIQ